MPAALADSSFAVWPKPADNRHVGSYSEDTFGKLDTSHFGHSLVSRYDVEPR
jgi:hypothetical protein